MGRAGLVVAICLGIGLGVPILRPLVQDARSQTAIQRKTLLQEDGPPGYQAVLNVLEIPPGGREIRHTHPGPLVGYILEGTLTLEHEGRATATYKGGQSFYVEAGKIHQGFNSGDMPVKLIATLVVEKGKPPSQPAP